MPINYPGTSSSFIDNIRIKATTDAVLGGVDGAANLGLQDLANRTSWQKAEDRLNFKNSIETASGGRATIMWDDNDNWHLMIRIEPFFVHEIDANLASGISNVIHPAFRNNANDLLRLWVSAFQVSENAAGLITQPLKEPVIKTLANARTAAAACGTGWHVLNSAEWGALALLSRVRKAVQRGNTLENASHETDYNWEKGILIDGGDVYHYPGSGPQEWTHNSERFGVADLVGNYEEWVDGIKVVNGKIYLNRYNQHDLAESSWHDTEIYFNKDPTNDLRYSNTGYIDDASYHYSFKMMEGDPGFTTLTINTTPILLHHVLFHTWLDSGTPKSTALLSDDSGDGMPGLMTALLSNGTFYITRGGGSESGNAAGLGALATVPSASTLGFRLAYVEII